MELWLVCLISMFNFRVSEGLQLDPEGRTSRIRIMYSYRVVDTMLWSSEWLDLILRS